MTRQQVQPVQIPLALQTCAPEPEQPTRPSQEATTADWAQFSYDYGRYVLALAFAGADCRRTVAAGARWSRETAAKMSDEQGH